MKVDGRSLVLVGLAVLDAASCTIADTRDKEVRTLGAYVPPAEVQACMECMYDHCGSPLKACVDDGACLGWMSCVQDCAESDPTPACSLRCTTAHPSAKAGYEAVYGCACGSCKDACKAETALCP